MNLKTLVRDLRFGLAALLAGQAVLADSLTSLGVPAKLITSAFGVLAVIVTAVTLISESQPTIPSAPAPAPVPAAPPAAPAS